MARKSNIRKGPITVPVAISPHHEVQWMRRDKGFEPDDNTTIAATQP